MLGEQEEGDDQEASVMVELNLLGLPLPPPGPPDEPLEEHEGAPCALPHPRGATVPAQSCGPSRRSGCAAACWAWRVRPAAPGCGGPRRVRIRPNLQIIARLWVFGFHPL